LSIHRFIQRDGQLSFIDLERGGFGEILPEVMIFPEGLYYTVYRKLKAPKLRIKNLTHTFVNTIFYFRINASIRRGKGARQNYLCKFILTF
jgi:hypothetical protein